MKWAIAMLFAAVLGAFVADVEARVSGRPELVIVCERGSVSRDVSHVASGSNCVLHDPQASTSVGAISVYDDSQAAP